MHPITKRVIRKQEERIQKRLDQDNVIQKIYFTFLNLNLISLKGKSYGQTQVKLFELQAAARWWDIDEN